MIYLLLESDAKNDELGESCVSDTSDKNVAFFASQS
jgi:hypothetical protein